MYIRLNVTTIDPDSRRPQGIIMAARALADEGNVTNEEAEAINRLIAWFNDNLPVPPENVRNVLSRRATFWFWKSCDTLPILEKAWELARLLHRHGVSVRVWRTHKSPGRIIWQDDYQAAAIIRDPRKGREIYTSRPLKDDDVP